MKGRPWLLAGLAVGVAIGIGKLPYLSGAASSLSDTSQRLVGSGGLDLVHWLAKHGAPRRVVEGLAAFVSILVPGVTALLLVLAARFTLRLRALIGLLVALLGAAAYHYLGVGIATGTLALALLLAGLVAVAATGPIVVLPLAALAALIGTEYLPRLVTGARSVPRSAVVTLHEAINSHPGAPLWLSVIALVVAAVPLAVAARFALR
jgi:hypothetical protein